MLEKYIIGRKIDISPKNGPVKTREFKGGPTIFFKNLAGIPNFRNIGKTRGTWQWAYFRGVVEKAIFNFEGGQTVFEPQK